MSRQCRENSQANMELPMVWVRLCAKNREPHCFFDDPVPAAIMTMRSGRGAMRKPLEISPRSPISSDAGSVSG